MSSFWVLVERWDVIYKITPSHWMHKFGREKNRVLKRCMRWISQECNFCTNFYPIDIWRRKSDVNVWVCVRVCLLIQFLCNQNFESRSSNTLKVIFHSQISFTHTHTHLYEQNVNYDKQVARTNTNGNCGFRAIAHFDCNARVDHQTDFDIGNKFWITLINLLGCGRAERLLCWSLRLFK